MGPMAQGWVAISSVPEGALSRYDMRTFETHSWTTDGPGCGDFLRRLVFTRGQPEEPWRPVTPETGRVSTNLTPWIPPLGNERVLCYLFTVFTFYCHNSNQINSNPRNNSLMNP